MKTDWKYMKLGEVCDLFMGKTPARKNTSYWLDKDFEWVSISDMTQGKTVPITKEYVSKKAVSECNMKSVPVGSVIMSFKLSIGKVAITDRLLYTNEAIMAFPINNKFKNILDVDYLYHCLKGIKWSGGNRAVMGLTLNKGLIKETSIPVPPLSVQKSIVRELDHLNNIIQKSRELLAEYDKLAESLFYEMFGDPVMNDKGWEISILKNIGDIITGKTPAKKEAKNYDSDDRMFVRPSDLSFSFKYINNTEQYISEYAFQHSRKLPKNTVLSCCIGSVGKVGVLKEEAITNQQINAILLYDEMNAIYVAYYLLAIKEIFIEKANAPVVPIINKTDFSKFPIPVPPLPLQQAFASKVEQIEQLKAKAQKTIEETQKLLDYTMDKYFAE